MKFLEALGELILGSGTIPETYGGYEILVFAVGCLLMGSLAFTLDWILFHVNR